jgi:hypothetical protein
MGQFRTLKPWTMGEIRLLRQLWGTLPAIEIAVRMGRTVLSVSRRAHELGLCRRHKRLSDYGRRIRSLHARGHTDNEIARRLGISTGSLHHWMRQHGLEANGKRPEIFREVKRREYRRVWREVSLTDARCLVHAAAAAARGWPQARSPQQADVLDVLEGGPKSGREIAAALGQPWRDEGSAAVSAHLRYLAKKGLIADSQSPADGRMTIYRLADGVRRHVAARERGEGPLPKLRKRDAG